MEFVSGLYQLGESFCGFGVWHAGSLSLIPKVPKLIPDLVALAKTTAEAMCDSVGSGTIFTQQGCSKSFWSTGSISRPTEYGHSSTTRGNSACLKISTSYTARIAAKYSLPVFEPKALAKRCRSGSTKNPPEAFSGPQGIVGLGWITSLLTGDLLCMPVVAAKA